MISNIIGISAGFDISKELGVMTGPGKANWVAASYPFVLTHLLNQIHART
jgi:hypothetical protein